MNTNQREIIKQLERIKEQYELSNLWNELIKVISKKNINNQEYNSERDYLYNNYKFEMTIINARDNYISSVCRTKLPVTYKEGLIDIILSIACIKVCEKIGKSYNNEDISSYLFIMNLFENLLR